MQHHSLNQQSTRQQPVQHSTAPPPLPSPPLPLHTPVPSQIPAVPPQEDPLLHVGLLLLCKLPGAAAHLGRTSQCTAGQGGGGGGEREGWRWCWLCDYVCVGGGAQGGGGGATFCYDFNTTNITIVASCKPCLSSAALPPLLPLSLLPSPSLLLLLLLLPPGCVCVQHWPVDLVHCCLQELTRVPRPGQGETRGGGALVGGGGGGGGGGGSG